MLSVEIKLGTNIFSTLFFSTLIIKIAPQSCFPLWHVKDLDKTTMEPTEVGSGVID
jgi:hypothetical protein